MIQSKYEYNQMQPNIQNSFLNNKYTKIYTYITERAKNRVTPLEYTEKHHIIPKCKSFGGPNTKDNMVTLTFKEHWICHHLLLKMCITPQQKYSMWFAFDRMGQKGKNSGRIINSKEFQRIKEANKKLCSGENHWAFGKTGSLCANYGKKNALGNKHTDKWKQEQSDARMGKCFLTDEKKEQIADKLSHNYQVICPDGSILFVKNLKKFCRDQKLNSGHMIQVALGKESHYKGYIAIKITNNEDILTDKELRERQKLAIEQHPLRYIKFQITFPDGHTEITNNLRQFCRENNLNSGDMTKVSLGKCKQHKGYSVTKL